MNMRRPLQIVAALTCVLGLSLSTGQGAAKIRPKDAVAGKTGPIRVLIPTIKSGEEAIIKRLQAIKPATMTHGTIKIEVVTRPWAKLEPHKLKDIDLILLPTQWQEEGDHQRYFDEIADQFQLYVKKGGGLLVCQPNATGRGTCTPKLLPYPITFNNWYDAKDPTRINLAPSHFITDDLPGNDMPFPADRIMQIDPHYKVLAKQTSTDSPSLAVCDYGTGRIVVQTASENPQASIPIGDEILRRMIVWAARRDR